MFRVPRAAAATAARLNAARSTAFTLIELITVIGIMALMMVIAIPAFQSVTKSSAVGIGAGHLVKTLALARAKAVTTRSRVRVVFADGANNAAIALPQAAYGVLISTNQDDSGYPASVWVYLDRWQTIPKGAFLTNLTVLSTYSVPFPSNSTFTANMRGIEFNSAGAVTSGSDLSILVMEGALLPNGSYTRIRVQNVVTSYVYAATGRAKVRR